MRANWYDVRGCFSFSAKETPLQLINRLAQHWGPRLGTTIPEITPQTPVRRERWTHEQIGAHLDRMAALTPKMLVTKPPRVDGGPIVIFELPDGKVGQLDGRHRCNLWRNRPGLYDVLILELQ
jgi:hypothetical protein